MPDLTRPLGRVGRDRFLARTAGAFDHVDHVNMAGRVEPLSAAVRRLDRQARIPMSAATLGSLGERIITLNADRAERGRQIVALSDHRDTLARSNQALIEQNVALIAENRQLSMALAEARGIDLAGEFLGDAQDSGVPVTVEGQLRNPLASIEERLAALEARQRGDSPPPAAPAGVDPSDPSASLPVSNPEGGTHE